MYCCIRNLINAESSGREVVRLIAERYLFKMKVPVCNERTEIGRG